METTKIIIDMKTKNVIKCTPEQLLPVLIGLLDENIKELMFQCYYLALEDELVDLKPFLSKTEVNWDTITLLDNLNAEPNMIAIECLDRVGRTRDKLINLYPGSAEHAFENKEIVELHKSIHYKLGYYSEPGEDYATCLENLKSYMFSLLNLLHRYAELVQYGEVDVSDDLQEDYSYGSEDFNLMNEHQNDMQVISWLADLYHDVHLYVMDIFQFE